MKGIADYVFIRHLSDGNHGAFWLAEPPARLGRSEPVAVKTLAQRATDNDFRRMANELRIYARVESPDLVEVIDAGNDGGRLFYATPYLPDGSLARPARPLGRGEIIGAVAAAARAAHQLHEAGIAHRDIKPSNVLLDRGRGRLADLGLAQIVNPGQTATGIGPVGTIEYLAPEVVAGAAASRASDVWSLGVTLHTALSGRPLYRALSDGSLIDALRQVVTDRPTVDDSLTDAETAVVHRCLAEAPTERFHTAAELAAALEGLHS